MRELKTAGPGEALAGLGRLVGCDVISCTSTEHTTRRLTGTVTDRPEQNLMRHPEFRAPEQPVQQAQPEFRPQHPNTAPSDLLPGAPARSDAVPGKPRVLPAISVLSMVAAPSR